MQIALDAMGGDHGPKDLIAGALLAVEEADLSVSLVGDESLIKSHLDIFNAPEKVLSRIRIVHAEDVVEMHDNPVNAIRKKRNSSIMVAFDLAKKGEVDAVVSAGNSGATLAAGIRKLGRLKGVSRPGISSLFPTLKEPVAIMDIGANVDCRADHLLQFAVMASCFSSIHIQAKPRVGLLSIGEEAGKGNSLVKETEHLLKTSDLNYIGNVEGRDVFKGDVDVVVCDGFVGNICLKMSEGLADAIMKMLKDEIVQSPLAKVGYLLSRKAFKSFKKRVDYEEYGGAPLLGIAGTGIVCHGKSNAQAIKNAIFGAEQMVKTGVNSQIERYLADMNGTAVE